MSPRKSRFRLTDILAAVDRIESYITNMDFQQFCLDRKTSDAVILNVEEIGEVSHHVEAHVKAKIPGVPWQDMYDNRRGAAHEYFRRDSAMIWHYITVTLAPIRAAIQAFLDKNPQDPL